MADLVERAAELAEIERALRRAAAGRGSVLLVEGEAGIGKSALLARARALAPGLGLTTFSAFGSPLEGAAAFGLARQLLLPALDEAGELLTGAASLAGPALGLSPAGAPPSPDGIFAAVHGLVWVVAAVAERRGPLLLCLDDLHCADPASLRFAAALAARAPETPVALLLAGRPAETLAPLRALAPPLQPSRLSLAGTAALLEREVGHAPDEAFTSVAHELTGGVPILVSTLAIVVRRDGLALTAGSVARLRTLGAAEIGERVAARLGTVSAAAVTLARALAIAATGARSRSSSRSPSWRPPRRPRPSTSSLPQGCSATSRAQARPSCTRWSRPPPSTASPSPSARGCTPARPGWPSTPATPGGRPCTSSPRRARATRPRSACSARPPTTPSPAARRTRPRSCSSGRWPSRLGRTRDRNCSSASAPPSCSPPTTTPWRGWPRRPRRSPTRPCASARARCAAMPWPSCAAGTRRAARWPRSSRRPTAPRSRTSPSSAASGSSSTSRSATSGRPRARRSARCRSRTTPTCARSATGCAASRRRPPGSPARRRSSAPGGRWPSARRCRTRRCWSSSPALALHYADEFDDARGWMAASLAFSRARGHVHSVQMMGIWMAVLEARAGRPGAAAESVLDTQQAGVEAPVLTTLLLAATQARVALERGRLDQADAAVEPALEDDPSLAPLHFVGDLLAARAAVRCAEGRAEEAVAEARRAGEATDGWGGSSPSTNGWRAELAFSLAAAGRAQEAAETAEAEVLAARRFGTPRPLATALRALALATQDPAVAGEALEVARSGAPALDVARSLLLAGGLAAHDRRAEEGVDLLGEAMDGAWRVGGERVSEQARAALVGLGARPRRLARRGIDALTPAEARTTRLIAEGVTNREAAETLFVTLGTIERHLTSAYRKLGIAGRAELAAAMTAEGERSLPSSRGD